jgi:hypothetical protein
VAKLISLTAEEQKSVRSVERLLIITGLITGNKITSSILQNISVIISKMKSIIKSICRD